MNDRRMRIYLDDHLALMVAEIELVARCGGNNRGTPLGKFLQQLENEVKAQKSIARDIIHRIGGKEGIESKAKQGAAWVAEKLGRFKLNDSLRFRRPMLYPIELGVHWGFSNDRSSVWRAA